MEMMRSILPYRPDFPQHLSDYHDQIVEAVKQKKHHDHRRHLFMNFLRLGFGVAPEEMQIEAEVTAAGVKGYIDALYKYVIFEFKSDLERERMEAELEIKKYFASRKKPDEYLAILTDGLKFRTCMYEAGRINFISSYELSKTDPLGVYRFFDSLLFTSKKITPKSIDVTSKFGLESAIFNRSRTYLDSLFAAVSDLPSVKTKFYEWNSLLGTVYGERIGDSTLFMRHTYLAVLARLMVAYALFPDAQRSKTFYRGILTGSFFQKSNLLNLAELDFFCWALSTPVESDFLGLMAKIESYLEGFRFDNIAEDLLKEIYQELVNPESRHALGEYYTPDWIADITLDELKYSEGILLDPACGSGTFLLAAIRRLRKNGVRGNRLVLAVARQIRGIDVHPLAVTMAKANVLLALSKELRGIPFEVYLPIYMADTLLIAENNSSISIPIPVSEDEAFHIPSESIKRGIDIDAIIDTLNKTCQGAYQSEQTMSGALKGLEKTSFAGMSGEEIFLWRQNFKLMCSLVKQERDSVWGFILKNAYRPTYMRRDKADYIVGNPPWLSYRYIKDKSYKGRVKELTLKYGLLDRSDVKLFTQLDTSTLFFVFSESNFLKDNGTIAFVLPKTTILPAKQHSKFQDRGVSSIHDFSSVTPLFNVRSVLTFRIKTDLPTHGIPYTTYTGVLPLKNMNWAAASRYLRTDKGSYDFVPAQTLSTYYHPRFLQGATIVPRCFWFVQLDKEAIYSKEKPFLESSTDALAESKKPWQFTLSGRVEKKFIFETVLAKGVIPFGIIRTERVFLPIQVFKNSIAMADSERLLELGALEAAKWMSDAERLWNKYRKSEERTLLDRLNYNQTLIGQNPTADNVVIYNTSGTHLAAALYISAERRQEKPHSHGFLADAKTYYYYPGSLREGEYLLGMLNSAVVNNEIKRYQPQGLWGERDIHRRPFEACAIPKFDPHNPTHLELASLGKTCRDKVKPYIGQLAGEIGRIRSSVRDILKPELQAIDKLASKILESEGQKLVMRTKKRTPGNTDLFQL